MVEQSSYDYGIYAPNMVRKHPLIRDILKEDHNEPAATKLDPKPNKCYLQGCFIKELHVP